MSQPASSILSAAPVAAPMQVAVSDDLRFLDLTTAQGEAIRLTAERDLSVAFSVRLERRLNRPAMTGPALATAIPPAKRNRLRRCPQD
jgi:hypothetical protein